MSQRESFDDLKPLDDLETQLVRAALDRPTLISSENETALRQALSVARLHRLEDRRSTHLLDEHTLRLRDEVTTLLAPQLGPGKTPSPQSLAAAAPLLQARARRVRLEILQAGGDSLDPADLDREIEQKALVLVCGGGGGTGYVHLGAFGLLEELALRPRLILGTSMGAVMGIFRARKESFDPGEMVSVLRSISYRKIFRLFTTDSRYGLPAALRLYLRAALGRHFTGEDGAPLRLSQMRVPIIISASGIRRGRLPQPPEYYERLISLRDWNLLSPNRTRIRIAEIVRAISEIAQLPDLVELHFGATPETLQFDALDAVGFSCALPGVVHYDVLRDDVRMHQLLTALLEHHDISRLIDGGLTANVPAVGSSRVDLQACKLEYSIVSPK